MGNIAHREVTVRRRPIPADSRESVSTGCSCAPWFWFGLYAPRAGAMSVPSPGESLRMAAAAPRRAARRGSVQRNGGFRHDRGFAGGGVLSHWPQFFPTYKTPDTGTPTSSGGKNYSCHVRGCRPAGRRNSPDTDPTQTDLGRLPMQALAAGSRRPSTTSRYFICAMSALACAAHSLLLASIMLERAVHVSQWGPAVRGRRSRVECWTPTPGPSRMPDPKHQRKYHREFRIAFNIRSRRR